MKQSSNMLDAANRGVRGYRGDECASYLATWRETERCLALDLPLPEASASELTDALDCGDYDSYLEPEELAKWSALYASEAEPLNDTPSEGYDG